MRQLRTCDFCGADAAGVYEVLPPELTPADDQRRVVLCEHCEETLTDVVEPLLTRLGVDADVDEQGSSGRRTQSGDVEVPDDASAETGASATPQAGGSESAGDAATVDVDAVDPAPSPPEPADHDSPDSAETAAADPLDADSVQTDESESSPNDETDGDDSVDAEGDAGAEDETGDDASSDEPVDDVASDEPEDSADGDGATADDTPAEPPQFRKVVRILQNREFPVERADVESLASNAYDLDDDEVADIFDYAVERGLLVDDGGTLRKP
ncbi:hypothetical protein GJR96_05465 [Haloferax sp. MBLA0076]|uniref:Uncharacterized protein n=1 Tax=Haloferax litoreum TaxID=2666140 RepID=A0A6A8GE08_9EURY|nr:MULTISPECIES: hypothetical protein [Haloferax]KAB1192921.1 hypothetical protein Hfx1148_05460 [Haloferax sp. CBA1148]MRX21408.1 hypothetical protein [Haloferax litoreum]